MFRSVVASALLIALIESPAAAQTTTSYSWTGTELISAYRLTRDQVASNYLQPPKAFPGLEFGGDFLIKRIDFVNPFSTAAGFLVDDVKATGAPFGSTHLVAYLGGFNLLDLMQYYAGDSGYSCAGIGGGCSPLNNFSVLVPANATVSVVAFRLGGGISQGGFFEFDSKFAQVTTVVPEPTTALLIATGLCVLFAVHRRRAAAS
jgi:hypothetical protein